MQRTELTAPPWANRARLPPQWDRRAVGSHLCRKIQHPSDLDSDDKCWNSKVFFKIQGGGREEIDPDLDLDVFLSSSKIISSRAFELLCNQRQYIFLRNNKHKIGNLYNIEKYELNIKILTVVIRIQFSSVFLVTFCKIKLFSYL